MVWFKAIRRQSQPVANGAPGNFVSGSGTGGSTANRASNLRDKLAWPRRRPRSGEVGYIKANDYPIYLDAGEHFMRLRTGYDYFPYPPMIGAMNAFMEQRDVMVWRGMYRKAAVGPQLIWTTGMSGTPIPVANLQNQAAVPGLFKMA